MQNSLMKSSLCLSMVAYLVVACGRSSTPNVLMNRSGRPSAVIYTPTMTIAIASETLASLDLSDMPGAVLELLKAHTIGLGAGVELVPTSENRDWLGRSVRLEQHYKGIPVTGAEVVVLFDRSGRLLMLNSSLVNNLNFDTSPELSLKAALQKAQQAVSKYLSDGDLRVVESLFDSRLVIAPYVGKDHHLTWRLDAPMLGLRLDVVASGALRGRIAGPLSTAHSLSADINIYNGSIVPVIPTPLFKGLHVLSNGAETDTVAVARKAGKEILHDDARAAGQNLAQVLDFYQQVFSRKSYDGEGAKVEASVGLGRRSVNLIKGNAAWLEPFRIFGFGSDGDKLGNFAQALDVVGHEFTHAVVSSTSRLEYFSEAGALNEHLADVFGAAIEDKYAANLDWSLIGETTLMQPIEGVRALRDMLNPGRGLSPQPGHVDDTPAEFQNRCAGQQKPADNCGVHILSGIPNRAAALVVNAVGWDKARPLFYRVMTQRLRSTSDFADYSRQLLAECELQQEADCAAVKASLAEVGL